MREERLGQADDRSWVFRLGFNELNVGVHVDDQSAPRGLGADDHRDELSKARIELRTNAAGKVTAGRPVIEQASPEARNVLGRFAAQLARCLELVSVACPDQEMQPGHAWDDARELPELGPGGEQPLRLALHYVYKGVRRVNGRLMAELAVTGTVTEAANLDTAAGKVAGTFLVDLETGVVAKADLGLDATLHVVLFAGAGTATNTLEVKLQRE